MNYIESVVDIVISVGGIVWIDKVFVDVSDVLRDVNLLIFWIVVLFVVIGKGEDFYKELIKVSVERIYDLGVRVYVFVVGRELNVEILEYVVDYL